MRFLRTNTACRVTVGPFFDKNDGITPETALTVTACKLTLMVDDGNVPTLVLDTAPTASGGANDMVHVTGDDAGFYDLELASGNVNYLGRAMLAITDAANHCPVFHEFMIVPAMVYDSMFLGTDVMQSDVTQLLGTAWLAPAVAGTPDVNAKQISGDATAADNAEAFFDGTGYAGTNNVIPTVTNTGALNGSGTVVLTDGSLTTTKLGAFALAKTTNITGFNDITAAAVEAAILNEGDATALLAAIAAKVEEFLINEGDATATIAAIATACNAAVVAGTVGSNVASILADTNELQTDWINGGRLDLILDARASQTSVDAISAAAIADAVWDEILSGHVVSGSAGAGLSSASAPTAAAVADAVWDEVLSGHATAGTAGAGLTAAQSAGDPWSTTVPAAYASGTAGYKFGNLPTSAAIASDLSAGDININTSPITLGNALNIYTGNDYKAANGKSITFSITSRSDLIGLIPHLIGESGDGSFDIAAVAVVSATQTITFGDLASATTSTLKAGSRENPHEGEYQINFLDGSGNTVTQAEGVMYVRRGLSA